MVKKQQPACMHRKSTCIGCSYSNYIECLPMQVADNLRQYSYGVLTCMDLVMIVYCFHYNQFWQAVKS